MQTGIAKLAIGTVLSAGLMASTVTALGAKSVRIDGSSTVAPITMAAAEMFRQKNRDVTVAVGVSGTGGGFKKFLTPEADLRTDINDASRPIKDSEIKMATELGIEYIELPVALDGIAVVVHPSNSFCDHLTVDELKRIWSPGSEINNWNQVRPNFPNLPLKLYGPGTDSGTFDFFTEVIVGKAQSCREDFTASENDNVLVKGVSGDRGGLGYFGFSYYEANESRIKLLAIDNGDGKPVAPELDNIGTGEYEPLARPLFLYVNRDSAERPEVQSFVNFIFKDPKSIVEHPRVGYVALPEEVYSLARERFERKITGTAYGSNEKVPLQVRYKLP